MPGAKIGNLEVNALKVWCHFQVNYLIIDKGYQTFNCVLRSRIVFNVM